MMEKRQLAIGDGLRLAWRFDGPVDAPVLLLSNSLGTTMEMWAPQIAVWARRFKIRPSLGTGAMATPMRRRVRIRWIGWDATPSNCSTDWVSIECISAGFPWAGWWGNGSPFTRRTASIGSCSPTRPPIWDRRRAGRRKSTPYAQMEWSQLPKRRSAAGSLLAFV